MKDFFELFINELKEAYAAERHVVKMLPKVLEQATSPKLREVIQDHLKESEGQLVRLERVLSEIKESPSKAVCRPMEGLMEEWKFVIKSNYDTDTQDAAIIGFLQKIEHLEIAYYGTLKTYAKHLKLPAFENLFKESAKEEGDADKKLTDIAEGSLFSTGVNAKACKKCA
jgi:ferritin-like metal-binding protein YciE